MIKPVLPFLLLVAACVEPFDEATSASELRSRCPVTDPECEPPSEPTEPPPTRPPGGGGGTLPPTDEDPACQQLVTGWVRTNPAYAATTGVPMNTPVTVSWDVTLPTSCDASGPVLLGGNEVPLQGSKVVTLLASAVFRLHVGTRQVAATPVKTILPAQVRITADTVEQRALFAQAAGTPGTTVLLKHDLELDLSGWALTPIWVASGVTIASEAPPPGVLFTYVQPQETNRLYRLARDSRNLGPKLHSRVRSPNGLLDLRGDNIKLRGFRLIGPDMAITDGNGKGIVGTSIVGLEIDRLEVAGFSLVGIYLQDPENRNNAFQDIEIHDCFFHHNQHAPGGNGYGVSVHAGARAKIRHNVFDFNRHAIMSGGEAGTGYWADENLVLRGGGYHEAAPGVTWHTHMFDVHGSDNCGVGSWLSDSLLNCGRAGDIYFVTRNAFQYSAGNAFKLRGTPDTGAWVTDNIFAHGYDRDAVDHTEYRPIESNNTHAKDTFGVYGTCDFDADGKDDLFLATGRTWWFSSGGAYHWTYLNSQTEELAQLGLGDFDHDGRCDVLRENPSTRRWELSSAGTGVFVPLATGFMGPLSQLRYGDFNGDGFTDIFQRMPDGQWFGYTFPTSQGPIPLQSSSKPIESLRFGDFDGDRITDVLAISGGVWSWSRSARESWRPLNSRYGSLDDILFVANIDGLPGDDVIRGISTSQTEGKLQISSGGRGPWTDVAPVSWSTHIEWDEETHQNRVVPDYALFFAGTFVNATGDSVLQLDLKTRFTKQLSAGQRSFAPHSRYAH